MEKTKTMIIVHKQTNGLKFYKCSTCGKMFNWSSNSYRFGKLEYKTIQEQEKKEKYFCSDYCVSLFEPKKTNL